MEIDDLAVAASSPDPAQGLRAALGTLGLDVGIDPPPLVMRPLPPRPTLQAVLKDKLPMTPAAKGVLQAVGKPMRRGGRISASDVLVALLERHRPDPGAALFDALGVDRQALRARLSRPAA
jgi:hypothetical protein